jgi:hypothetical protein
MLQEEQSRVIIDSDEEIDGGFSCLLDVKETGISRNKIFRTIIGTANVALNATCFPCSRHQKPHNR